MFRGPRVAVFVDGCFWHGCKEHSPRPPATNDWYWPEKIQRNRERDADTDTVLRAAGWAVVRVWEHEDPASAADQIALVVASRRAEPPSTD